MDRRTFLTSSAAATTTALLATGQRRQPRRPKWGGFRMGAQSYCFRQHDYQEGIGDGVKELGLGEHRVLLGPLSSPAAGHPEDFPEVKAAM